MAIELGQRLMRLMVRPLVPDAFLTWEAATPPAALRVTLECPSWGVSEGRAFAADELDRFNVRARLADMWLRVLDGELRKLHQTRVGA